MFAERVSRRRLGWLLAWARKKRSAGTAGLKAPQGSPRDARCWDQNVGLGVGEWSERARLAVDLLATTPAVTGAALHAADFGCGRQTLRALLPPSWTYAPFDWTPRSDDTFIWDFDRGCPDGTFDVVFILGVLEYLQDPLGLLAQVVPHCRYLVFSYNSPTDSARRKRQGWSNCLTFEVIEKVMAKAGAALVGVKDLDKGERLYAFRGTLADTAFAGGAS